MLEKGTARKLTDLYSSQTWARRLKWATPHVMEESKDSIWPNFNAGHGYGGAAIHHYGVWPRYHPEDMKEYSIYGQGLDWPFEYDALRPWYDKVQSDVGMAGDAENYAIETKAAFMDYLISGLANAIIPTTLSARTVTVTK